MVKKLKLKLSRLFWVVILVEGLSLFLLLVILRFSPNLIQENIGVFYNLFGLILIIILIISLIGIFEVLKVIRLIEKISFFSHQLAAGNFQTSLQSKRKDELGILVKDLSRMQERLKNDFHRLKAEKEKTQAIVEKMEEAVLVFNAQKQIVLMNATAKSFLGQHQKTNTISLQKQGDRHSNLEKWLHQVEHTKQSFSLPRDAILLLPSGEKIVIEGIITPLLSNGKVENYILVFRDVTKKREVEEMRDSFVFILSHQLRGPISSIKWNTEMLLEARNSLPEKRKEALSSIYQETINMVRLLDNLLEISNINRSSFAINLQPASLEKITQRIVDELTPWAKARNIPIVTHFSAQLPLVKIDRLKISQAVKNIIENAIVYGKMEGKVIIAIQAKEGRVVLSCRDNGIGIAAQDKSKIFHQFFRSLYAQKKQPTKGFGLGLYIAKVFVERIPGGKIWFHSDGLGKGSTFYISFPGLNQEPSNNEKETKAI